MRRLLWIVLWVNLVYSLFCLLGCRQRDGLIDAGPVFIDSDLLPDNFRCPMPPREARR